MHSTKTSNLKHHIQQLRQQFAQAGQDTLDEAFSAQELERILAEESGCHRQRIYPPMVTLRLFVDQILSTDQACQEAVSQRLVARVVAGQMQCSLNTGPYCKARKRLALRLPQRLCTHLGEQLERCAAPLWGWRGRSIKLFDATTVSMPDTPQNQHTWPQSSRQKPGLGFPLARIGALISLSSGAVINYAVGPMKGKCSGEQALLREISGSLCRNDLLLADALHSTWWAVQMLVQRGVDLVMPNDGRRRVDFSEGRIHSESDHVVWWPKPKRVAWIGKAQYEQMPAGMWVREVRVNGTIIVTTMLESTQISPEELVMHVRHALEHRGRFPHVEGGDEYGCFAMQVTQHGEEGNCGVFFDLQPGALDYGPCCAVGERGRQRSELYERPAVNLGFRLSSAPVPRSHDKLPCAHVAAQHFPLRLAKATWSH